MAAGLGSRYGGLKQAEPVGPHGELLIDYSIHDALEAGFGRVICIIKRENLGIFEERIGSRHRKEVKIEYVFQDMTNLPEGFTIPEGREKPWGTAHAVMCCEGLIHEPFIVINADDYYGPEPFRVIYRFLTEPQPEDGKLHLAMAGYHLANTLTAKGTVARGVCTADRDSMLTSIDERLKIGWVDNKIIDVSREEPQEYAPDTIVSMNCWGCPAEIMEVFRPQFAEFLRTMPDPKKSEYLLPVLVEWLLEQDLATVKVLPVHSRWYGVTYREDHPTVVRAMKKLHEEGAYPDELR